jgi:hypothetical protein
MIEPDIELNAAVARDVMRWTALGAHLWQDRQTSTVYYTGHDPKRVFIPHTVFNPSSDALHAAWVEEQVMRLGKREAYFDALIYELACGEDTPDVEHRFLVERALLHATSAQRCRAALTVVRDAG